MNFARENETLEFKSSLSQLSRAMESICAMLNKHGYAVVLFGVNDNGDVVGVDIGNKTSKDISEEIARHINPSVVPYIKEEIYDGKTIVRVEVHGTNKPYSVNAKYLIRSGSENKKIEANILKQLLFSNSDELMVETESFDQELTFNQLKQLYILNGVNINNETFEKNLGLLNKNNKYNLLAEILSDSNNCSIKVVRFNGEDKSEMVVRNEFGYCCLALSMQRALEYVTSLNETRVVISGKATRNELHLFDESSLREAWNNACLHTRWDRMIPPVIYIYSNRIEIVSIGGLPIDYSKEDFYRGISNPINKHLQKIFGQLSLVEQTGFGVPEIIRHYGKEAFEINDNNIIITLKFPFYIKPVINQFTSLNQSQIKVLKAIINKPSITTNELVNVIGLQSSRINEILKELKQLNKLKRVGARRNGFWEVTSDN